MSDTPFNRLPRNDHPPKTNKIPPMGFTRSNMPSNDISFKYLFRAAMRSNIYNIFVHSPIDVTHLTVQINSYLASQA